MTAGGRVAGKRAIVVGAGQTPGETLGNGRATALLLAREGAEVLCVDRVPARAEGTAAEIVADGGVATAMALDITAPDAGERLVEHAGSLWGGIDIVVNNVGIGLSGDGPAHIVSDEVLERTLEVNFTGTWRIVRAVLGPMRREGAGSIVNISSLASLAGATQLAYEVSKAAVNRLTVSVANTNAKHGVRCNAVLPGFIDTPMAVEGIAAATGRSTEDVRAGRDARVPLRGRMGTAWDTAHAVLYLASDDAGFVTGVLLAVDGGMGVRIG